MPGSSDERDTAFVPLLPFISPGIYLPGILEVQIVFQTLKQIH